MATSDFELKPLRVSIATATEDDLASVPEWPAFQNQRRPEDFRNGVIKADRELRRDPGYAAEFTNHPIVVEEVAVALSEEEYRQLHALMATGLYGATDGDALRYVLFSWWIENFMQGPKHFEDLKA